MTRLVESDITDATGTECLRCSEIGSLNSWRRHLAGTLICSGPYRAWHPSPLTSAYEYVIPANAGIQPPSSHTQVGNGTAESGRDKMR